MSQQWNSPPEMTIDLAQTHVATLETNHGTITIELDAERSPLTVNNFVFLADQGYYDGVIFHRVIPGFVAQGGDPTGTGTGGPGYRFRDELEGSGRYVEGTVAMANAGPNTNGSQFFICLTDVGLPHQYTIFGTVTDGMDAVHSIAEVPTGPGDKPKEDCVIESVTIDRS